MCEPLTTSLVEICTLVMCFSTRFLEYYIIYIVCSARKNGPRITTPFDCARNHQGFDTTFTFRLSSPSLRCNMMDGVHTFCRSRGADGLAFVVQGEGSTALGSGGKVKPT